MSTVHPHDRRRRREREPLEVLIVDDSAIVREVLREVLSASGRMRVTTASDPYIAMYKMQAQRPDVVLLDIYMPRMDGFTFLRKIMAENPVPVVICSAMNATGADLAVRALEEGAVDVVCKPRLGVKTFLEESAAELVEVVEGAAQAHVHRRGVGDQPTWAAAPRSAFRPRTEPPITRAASARLEDDAVVAIGASTGGTEALARVLAGLPADSAPIVIVQHMPEYFTAAFAKRLDGLAAIEVREAVDGDTLRRGLALAARGGSHLRVHRDASRALRARVGGGPATTRHRPSVDLLFQSVAEARPYLTIGVLLTGMGDDGADGMVKLARAGAITIAQDEATSVVFGMPRAAIAAGGAQVVLPLDQIAEQIAKGSGTRRS